MKLILSDDGIGGDGTCFLLRWCLLPLVALILAVAPAFAGPPFQTFQLLFAAGHSFVGEGETYTYLSLYWTWGGGSQDKPSGSPNPFHSLLLRR